MISLREAVARAQRRSRFERMNILSAYDATLPMKEEDLLEVDAAIAAVLEAMGEPSEGMVVQGDHEILAVLNDHTFALKEPTVAHRCWSAMLAAFRDETLQDVERSSRKPSRSASGGRGTLPTPTGRCETCAHWSAVEPDYAFDQLVMGKCTKIRQREDIIEPARDVEDWDAREIEEGRLLMAEKAIAVDGSGYYAAVRTTGDFGCVLHVPAPPNTAKEPR